MVAVTGVGLTAFAGIAVSGADDEEAAAEELVTFGEQADVASLAGAFLADAFALVAKLTDLTVQNLKLTSIG